MKKTLKPAAWYALRRTLPSWSAGPLLAELVVFCRRNRVDEVIIKVDTEEFSHGLPTVEWLDGYLPVLRQAKADLAAAGVRLSINPWLTLGHADRGRDTKAVHPDVDLIVGHDGTPCRDCACPLSPGWRRLTHELWRRYASIEPATIWVEDDIRLFNHMPARAGCFCPLHLREFGRVVGRDVTREELVAALFAPGAPHPWRQAWLEMNGRRMVEVAAHLERAVHEVSPATRLGLMSSDPNSHATEGRDWAAFSAALRGDQPLLSRPAMFAYNEGTPRMLYDSAFYVRQTAHCLGRRGVVVQTEVDNGLYSTYAKSVAITRLQIALSFALGADGVTLSLFDHLGTPMAATPEFGDMLRKDKAFFHGLAAACRGGRTAGVQLMHAPGGAAHVRLRPGADYRELAPEGQAWRSALEPLGAALTFEDSPVAALSGQVVRALDADKIKCILSRGSLLDLTAARCLVEMGYGDLVGVSVTRVFQKRTEPLAAEEHFHTGFGGAERMYMSLTLWDAEGGFDIGELAPAPGATVVSRIVNPDAKPVYPMLTVFRNQLGGRVAVYPVDMEPFRGLQFLNPQRQQQMHAVLSWLARGRVPLLVRGGAYPLAFRMDFPNRIVAGMLNLSLDDWPEAAFALHVGRHTPGRVTALAANGEWKPDRRISSEKKGTELRLRIARRIPALSVTAVEVALSGRRQHG